MKYTPQDIAKLGTILGIWAHPDDEAWTTAGILAAGRQNNQRVVVVTATRGESGKTADESRWPQANLREIRTKELEASLATLGVIEHHWLNYPDGTLSDQNQSEAAEKIADIIRELDPNTIFTFCQDGLTGHEDHKAVCQWTIEAARIAGSPAKLFGAIEATEKYQAISQDCSKLLKHVYFNTDKPKTIPMAQTDLCFALPQDLQVLKRMSLQCQASQTAQLFENHGGQTFIYEQIACECFIQLNEVPKSS